MLQTCHDSMNSKVHLKGIEQEGHQQVLLELARYVVIGEEET